MGSSMVIIWSLLVLLASSIIAARVVDFPHPVGPVTRTIPLGSVASCRITGGSPSSSQVRILSGISLKTAATPSFCLKKLAL